MVGLTPAAIRVGLVGGVDSLPITSHKRLTANICAGECRVLL